MKVLAIDPGHTCGVAIVRLGKTVQVPNTVESVSPGHVVDLLERPTVPGREWDIVIVEEFRLYPWLARSQAFSDFKTVEVIGVIKYLTAKHNLPLYMQQAGIKKEARSLAEDHGWPMVERSLGSGKGKYRGPDFDFRGQQHGRDALAHAVYWAWRNPHSPTYEG